MNELYINAALDLPIDTTFTYRVPDHFKESVEKGKRVLVSFGKRVMTAIILDIIDETHLKNLKSIKSVLDEQRIISDELIEFCRWVSGYYLVSPGQVLFSAIPGKINIRSDIYYFTAENYLSKLDSIKFEDEIMIDIIKTLEKNSNNGLTKNQIEKRLKYDDLSKYIGRLAEAGIVKGESYYSKPTKQKIIKVVRKNFSSDELTPLIKELKIKSVKQINFLKKLLEKAEFELSALIKETGISPSTVNLLLKKELITIQETRKHRDTEEIFKEVYKKIILNDEQKFSLDKIQEAIELNSFKAFLLFGVTGSGKTEIYINAIEKVLSKGKTAIVLVPEISLTPQLIHRFRNVFGNQVGVIHSKLSDGERLDTYDRIVNGTFKIIIGARSALFAPLKNIGIIIVDEEHDWSYKQENSPRYNGRDAAIYRARLNNAVVILGSATPSLESYYNAQTEKYELLSLMSRVSNMNMPEIKIIDLLKRDKLEWDEDKKDFFDSIDKVRIKFLSKELIYEIGERLLKKESIIILQNRRGYHSYIECLNCGNVEMCKRCNVALTYHKGIDLLKCHHCGLLKEVYKSLLGLQFNHDNSERSWHGES